jgi:hypothetical protein
MADVNLNMTRGAGSAVVLVIAAPGGLTSEVHR